MVITSTPLRVSFFGGGTDYPLWYREHGGAVLATTIDKFCFITCRWLPPFFEYHSRVSYSKVENVSANAAIERLKKKPGFVDFPEGFQIHRRELGLDSWTGGFVQG